MTDFTKIKSNYVKEKIKGLSYSKKNKKYINDLMKLERSIVEGFKGWAVSLAYHSLKNKYNKDYDLIFKELDPEGYKEWIQEMKIETRNTEKWQKEMLEQEGKEDEVSKFTWKLMQNKEE